MFLFPYDTQIYHFDFGNVMEIDTFVNISSNGVFKDDLYSASNEFHLKSTETKIITWQVGRMTCTQNIIFRSCSQHACVLTPRKYHQNMIIVSAMNNFRPRLSAPGRHWLRWLQLPCPNYAARIKPWCAHLRNFSIFAVIMVFSWL